MRDLLIVLKFKSGQIEILNIEKEINDPRVGNLSSITSNHISVVRSIDGYQLSSEDSEGKLFHFELKKTLKSNAFLFVEY